MRRPSAAAASARGPPVGVLNPRLEHFEQLRDAGRRAEPGHLLERGGGVFRVHVAKALKRGIDLPQLGEPDGDRGPEATAPGENFG